jgi:hypothetical protein
METTSDPTKPVVFRAIIADPVGESVTGWLEILP